MTIWVVRAGRHGERENLALEENRAFIGWEQFGDLSSYRTIEEIRKFLEEMNPDWSSSKVGNYARQLLSFIEEIQVDDTIALPLKGQPAIVFGRVVGGYKFIAENPEGARHSRKVKWDEQAILKSSFGMDLLYSFNIPKTVFRVNENKEKRIRTIVERKSSSETQIEINSDAAETEESEALDLAQLAKDQISNFVGREFKGHKMESLVAEVLKAQGFKVRSNPRKGSDGGADILAGQGPMGFDEPHICVQVKSGSSPIGSKDYDELKGVIEKFNATHGLFVSWGGFNGNVKEEAKRDFFKIRLWNAEDLINEIQEVYSSLPKELQAELPMQQSWLLVDVDEE